MNRTNTTPGEDEIHAYVDGRLDDDRRGAVECYLEQHPERAEQVRAWRRDAQQLRAGFAAWPALADNPALDPSRIRANRREHAFARWAMAAMLVLGVGLGGFGGWRMHGWQTAQASPPMGDALAAYRLVAFDRDLRLDVVSDRESVLQHWLDDHFAHTVHVPNLRDAGYRPVGGRLFATEQGVAAMVLYQDDQHHAITFYVRPPGARRHFLPPGQRAEGGLLAQYGSDRSYNFAMVSRTDDPGRQAAARALEGMI